MRILGYVRLGFHGASGFGGFTKGSEETESCWASSNTDYIIYFWMSWGRACVTSSLAPGLTLTAVADVLAGHSRPQNCSEWLHGWIEGVGVQVEREIPS